jgi:hypothetical protein
MQICTTLFTVNVSVPALRTQFPTCRHTLCVFVSYSGSYYHQICPYYYCIYCKESEFLLIIRILLLILELYCVLKSLRMCRHIVTKHYTIISKYLDFTFKKIWDKKSLLPLNMEDFARLVTKDMSYLQRYFNQMIWHFSSPFVCKQIVRKK